MQTVHVLGIHNTYVRKYRVHGTRTVFKFNRPPSEYNELEWVRKGFNEIVERSKSEALPTDYLGFTLNSLNLKNKEPGYVALRPAPEITGDILWKIFGGIIQSNAQSVTSSDTFQVNATRVNVPVGSGRKRPGFYNTFEEECKARRGIVVINNKDNLCLARALVVAKAHVKHDPQYELIKKDRANRQTLKAHKLLAKARVQIPEEGAGIPELEKLQEHLCKYKITVYNYDRKGRDVYFCGENENAQYNINLLFCKGHYNVITSLTAAFVCKFFCEACHVPYEHKGEHRCVNICQACQITSPPCKLVNEGITCPQCNRQFKNQLCFIAHQGEVCKSIKKCIDCGKFIFVRKRKSPHQCGEVYCSICTEFMPADHLCYMRVDTRTPRNKEFALVFFDLETRQDETLLADPEKHVHKVNLCVSQQFCYKCVDNSQSDCTNCQLRTRVFKNDPIADFMNYVLGLRKKFKEVCVIAHNGQGFDFQFILKYVLEETKFTPDLISRGTKLILLEMDKIRFVDSLSYFPMSLSALPKAFDLPAEKKKGFFPHLFNTVENQNYVGPMPSIEHYCPDSMFEETYTSFKRWYDEQVSQNYVFDFQKELLEYCISDVEILAQACIKFRTLLLEQCDVDPFLEAVTIASACNLAFRRNFLKPNTIGLIPKNGYRLTDVQSATALQWLTWEEERRGVRIQHAGRGREVQIDGVKVDGFDGRRIFEFHGCYFHGCPKCFPYKREEPLKEDPSDSLHLRFERTKSKIAKLSNSLFEIVEMWECDFNKFKKDNQLAYLNKLPILNTLPLDPRQAFFGGRTGNVKSYYKCKEGETVQYVDVCSLYPYVNKYCKYPVGHPTIHIGDNDCRDRGMDVEGLVKCKILPPRDLYHPVLPTRMHGKLMFILCKKCGESLCQEDCDHSYEERALVGTWTMDEVRKAVDKGYVILEMYELWEYEMVSYESGGLFTSFVNKFLKLKQEASGYPSWCETEEDKDRYISDYFEHEGVQLEKSNICRNAGLRSLAKLMLNSFWGKFGQRENQTKTKIIREPKEFFNMLTSPGINVNTFQIINEEVLLVNWENIEEAADCLRTVNVVIAAYTTAHARLKLYEYLDALGAQVLYYDTDSVIMYHRNGLYRVNTGDYLGQMTDELAKDYGPGSYIVEFVSGGPKTYAYLVYSTNLNKLVSVCKIKGLTLNLKTSESLNFETLKEMVLSEVQQTLEIKESRIRRTKDRDIVTASEVKIFKVTGPKRKLDQDFDTLPFGFSKRQKQ